MTPRDFYFLMTVPYKMAIKKLLKTVYFAEFSYLSLWCNRCSFGQPTRRSQVLQGLSFSWRTVQFLKKSWYFTRNWYCVVSFSSRTHAKYPHFQVNLKNGIVCKTFLRTLNNASLINRPTLSFSWQHDTC